MGHVLSHSARENYTNTHYLSVNAPTSCPSLATVEIPCHMQMEDKHKLALKNKEAVEQQHRLSLAQEFHRGKTAGRQLIVCTAALPSRPMLLVVEMSSDFQVACLTGEQDERARNVIVQARHLARVARPSM
jgi:hypothetical protein